MDPIKVDFSKKDGGRKKEIVIPPEKAALKIVLSLIGSVLTALIAFYVMMPAINFKDYNFYLYVGVVAASYVVFHALLSNVMNKPEYAPYVKKRAIVPGIIILILLIVVGAGYAASSVFFRAKAYSRIISVADASFAEDIEQQDAASFSSIPKLDEQAAAELASRALSDVADLGGVSQFTIYPSYTQINYQSKPVRVVPLQYANIIKWLTNRSAGLPGYIIIDMANESSDFVAVENGIKYSPAEHFNRLLKRHLRFEFPTYMFGDATFEIDDNGTPYWVCARIDNTIGLFGGTDVIGAVLVDATTGECQYYDIATLVSDPALQWLDRIYDSDLLVEQYDFYGKYRGGFWNSILGQKDVVVTTDGYNYIAKDDDVWMYTGITSITSDQSITGFVLINQRTKEATYYRVSGGTENSAKSAAEGRVQEYEYKATFPLLLNIGGEPTYFMSLKDANNIVRQYAMIHVENYNKIGATGTDLKSCLEKYIASLEANKVNVDSLDSMVDEMEDVTPPVSDEKNPDENTPAVTAVSLTGVVGDIRSQVIGGETYYYFTITAEGAPANYFSVSASDAEEAVLLNKGDNVTVTYNESNDKIIAVKTFEIK